MYKNHNSATFVYELLPFVNFHFEIFVWIITSKL